MRRHLWALLGVVVVTAGCAPSANVEQERAALMARDKEWSQTAKDPDKMASFFATDGSVYATGMPVVTGTSAIRQTLGQMLSTPGFDLQWAAAKADVGTGGDVGYTTGTYQMTSAGGTEKGKYVTVWKKQDGQWKVAEDIFNADASPAPAPGPHTLVPPAKVTFGPGPASLPPGATMAVISGDPTKAEPFVLRAQLPAGYSVPPHSHPTDEHITVLSGTLGFGMGDTLDKAALQDVAAGGYALMPAQMHHYVLARTATTIQVHAMGPFAVNYVNPADDPSPK
jgi:ketosteroid isomerase-like protein/quercetin dioxygenase-like cupin family protein